MLATEVSGDGTERTWFPPVTLTPDTLVIRNILATGRVPLADHRRRGPFPLLPRREIISRNRAAADE